MNTSFDLGLCYTIGIDLAKAGSSSETYINQMWNTSFHDKIDLDDFNFLEVADYVQCAYDHPDMLKSWDRFVGAGYGPFGTIVAHYFEFKEILLPKDEVLEISKILQNAGVDIMPAYNIYRLKRMTVYGGNF